MIQINKDEYALHLIDELAEIGKVTSKKMFGGVGFFLDKTMFAKLSGDGTLYFRVDESNRADYEALGAEQFNSDAKKKGMPYYQVPTEIIADNVQLVKWAKTAYEVAVANKKKS